MLEKVVVVGTAIAGAVLAVVAVGALLVVVAPIALAAAVVAAVRYERSVEGLRERTREALDERERCYFDEAMEELARNVDAPLREEDW